MNIDRSFYKSSTYDPESKLPIYVFDSTFIPQQIISNNNEEDYFQSFANEILDGLPNEEYCLVFFTNGFSRYDLNLTSTSASSLKIPLNIIKFFKLVPQRKKNFLLKLYIVHGNWIIKSIVELFKTLWGFGKTIIHCENLSILSHHIDITKLPISLATYVTDKSLYKNEKIFINKHLKKVYGKPLIIYNQLSLKQFSKIYNNLIAYLLTPKLNSRLKYNEWQILIRCNNLDDETKVAVDILSDCIKRDQSVFLSDFSFLEHYMIIIKFILKLSDSNNPIIPIEILLVKNVDFDNISTINSLFNSMLSYRHLLLPNSDTINEENGDNSVSFMKTSIDSYDNAYILIKLFKLFYTVLNKLKMEIDILDPNAKNIEKSKDRQALRLILSFTKVLYDDDPSIKDSEDLGFDNLFKFLSSLMKFFDKIKVINTPYTMEDFNNHITFEDFLAFETFKNKTLGINEIIQDQITIIENKNPVKNTSPIKSKSMDQFLITESESMQLRSTDSPVPVPPTPPLPRKQARNISPSSPSLLSSSSSSSSHESLNGSISYSKSTIDSANSDHHLSHNISQLLIDEEKIEVSPIVARNITNRLKNELIKPSNNVTGKLIKYTEKDLVVKQEADRQQELQLEKLRQQREMANSITRNNDRGRKVSRLARLYEDRILSG